MKPTTTDEAALYPLPDARTMIPDIASMTRAQLISALADISAENFSEEPENADQPAAIEYWRSLTTADLRAELEAARG